MGKKVSVEKRNATHLFKIRAVIVGVPQNALPYRVDDTLSENRNPLPQNVILD